MKIKIIPLLIITIILILIINNLNVNAQNNNSTHTFDRLIDVEWKPDDSYAIITGEKGTVLIYDGNEITDISYKIDTKNDLLSVSWKPDGSYALIIGDNGCIFKFDGNNFLNLSDNNVIKGKLFEIKWDFNGTYALIIEYNILVNEIDNISYNLIKYDGTTFTYLRKDYEHIFTSITFKPNNNNAYIFGTDIILIYNGSEFKGLPIFKWEYHEAAWSPNSEHLFVVSLNGIVFKFDDNGDDTALSTPTSLGFNCIDWNNENDALIGGSDLILYKGKENNFIDKSNNLEKIYVYRSIDWANNGSCALIVGYNHYFSSESSLVENGALIKYDGNEVTILMGEVGDNELYNGEEDDFDEEIFIDHEPFGIYIIIFLMIVIILLLTFYRYKKRKKRKTKDIE